MSRKAKPGDARHSADAAVAGRDNAASPRAAAARGGTHGEDDSYFAMLQSRMSPQSQRTMGRMEAVKGTYVACGRDILLARSFEMFLENVLTKRGDARDQARIFIVTGDSGAGKTAALRHLLKGVPCLQPITISTGKVRPCVSVSLGGYTQPRILAQRIITASGYTIRAKVGLGDLWDQLPWRLRIQRTFLVHVDETHHLIKDNASQQTRQDLADAIKGAGTDEVWPIAFVLSGLPKLARIPLQDEQVERRGSFFHFADVRPREERDLIVNIVRSLASAAALDADTLLEANRAVPDIIAHCARNRYGRICQVVEAALHYAIKTKEPGGHLTLRDFERAYDVHSHSFGIEGVNPFNTQEWWKLPMGSFIIDPTREGPGNLSEEEGGVTNSFDDEGSDADVAGGDHDGDEDA